MEKVSSKSNEGESELSSGMLYSTAGLVAGGSLGGIAIAIFAGVREGYLAQLFNVGARYHLEEKLGSASNLLALGAFALLIFSLYWSARQELE